MRLNQNQSHVGRVASHGLFALGLFWMRLRGWKFTKFEEITPLMWGILLDKMNHEEIELRAIGNLSDARIAVKRRCSVSVRRTDSSDFHGYSGWK